MNRLLFSVDFRLREETYQLTFLCCMIVSLPWIHHERKIEANAKSWFLISPYLFDLPSDSVSLDGISIVANRNYYNPVHR